MRIGKLTNEQLKSVVFSRLRPKGEVLLRAGVGEDCAAIDFNGEACVLSTDPITGATENLGRLAVNISCNDIASSGAQPAAMLVSMLIPPDKTLTDIEKVLDELCEEADSLGVDIIGGHTEITDAVTRIVISTTVIGKIDKEKLVTSGGAKNGDDIIMTGYAALEGTYIIASEYKDKIKDILTKEDLKEIEGLGEKISVINEGVTAGRLGATAMHDVTEGGIYGAVYELCEASGVGCEIYENSIPVLDVTSKICRHLGINPYRLIGSGSMLITTKNKDPMLKGLSLEGIIATVIGKVTDEDLYVVQNGNKLTLLPPESDELFSI